MLYKRGENRYTFSDFIPTESPTVESEVSAAVQRLNELVEKVTALEAQASALGGAIAVLRRSLKTIVADATSEIKSQAVEQTLTPAIQQAVEVVFQREATALGKAIYQACEKKFVAKY